MLPATAHHSQP
ncbi:hypothetical protein ECEC4421_3213, partial [Escherichia coli EC4421]